MDVCTGYDDTLDTDLDGIADGCDVCPDDANDDSDGDGICDSDDICTGDDTSGDTDNDGLCDDTDVEPNCATNDSDECGKCGGDNSSCSGCTDPEASNYDPNATIDDGNCVLAIKGTMIPENYSLSNIYPNPFNPVANIAYGIAEYTNVQIAVFDLSGKQVESLINEFQIPGYYSIIWNAENYPSGFYFVRMIAGRYINIQKLLLVK